VTLQLHADERSLYEKVLRRRAKQLASLMTVQAASLEPETLALFVGSVLRAAVPLCGDALRSELFEWLARKGREDLGLCAFCGATKDANALVCVTCSNEIEVLDLQLRLGQPDGTAPQ
jgi:hypothetical protein